VVVEIDVKFLIIFGPLLADEDLEIII